jgi:ABC-type phosphonate transport system ATPase subunit
MSAAPPSTAAGDAPVLKLLNVESAYGPIKAIRGVSLKVRRGEIATVLGSNGAGKTTNDSERNSLPIKGISPRIGTLSWVFWTFSLISPPRATV